eukprot:1820380-Prymnesium_polylepis.1
MLHWPEVVLLARGLHDAVHLVERQLHLALLHLPQQRAYTRHVHGRPLLRVENASEHVEFRQHLGEIARAPRVRLEEHSLRVGYSLGQSP